MRGRILNIKKSSILRCSFLLTWLLIIGEILLSTLLLKNNYLWFYGLCLFLGLHLLLKSTLFHLDSCCYFGFLLFFIGISGILANFTPLGHIFLTLITFAFGLASILTYLFFDQQFHFFIAIILFFVAIGVFFSQIGLIPFWISLAILAVGVLLFILKYLVFVKRS